MPRFHFFEWEDQSWFPDLFRNFITDHLAFHVQRLFIPVAPKLALMMEQSNQSQIIDLCSGGGGPLISLVPKCSEMLGKPVTATLTDLYPNISAFERTKALSGNSIDYQNEPISAMNCPRSLIGIRTLFTALHHFKPDDVKKILADAAEKQVAIGAFEIQERGILNIIMLPLLAFFTSFFFTPFVGQMTPGRFFFTYLIPLAPLFYTWDTAISCLRTYSPKELDELTKEIEANGYRWESGQIPALSYIGPYNITYLIGVPVASVDVEGSQA